MKEDTEQLKTPNLSDRLADEIYKLVMAIIERAKTGDALLREDEVKALGALRTALKSLPESANGTRVGRLKRQLNKQQLAKCYRILMPDDEIIFYSPKKIVIL
jgi:hypothetical protein